MLLRAFVITLVLLTGGAFVWVIAAGPDNSSSAQRSTSLNEKQAVRVEKRLAKEPGNEALQIAAMKTWIEAGGERFEGLDFSSKPLSVPNSVVEDYEAGLRAWSAYLKQADGEASKSNAESAALVYFQLAEIGSPDPDEAAANVAEAVKAQKIVCEHEATLFTLSDLAVYHYFNGEYAAGDRAAQGAAASAVKEGAAIKPQGVIGQLNEYRERGEKFVARVKRGFTTLEETGEEELETPIKAYGAPAGINGYEPGTR